MREVRIFPLALSVVVLSSGIAGCSFFGKSEPFEPRYFSPERFVESKPKTTQSSDSGLELRLGMISSRSDIRQNLIFRDSDVELGYDEERRWTERPEVYLRRALSRSLFEERGIRRVVSGSATTLEVELVAFEELRQSRCVRMTVVVVLHDEHLVQLEQTLSIDRPVEDRASKEHHGDAVAQAFSSALTAIVQQVADDVRARLLNESRETTVSQMP